MKIREKLNLMKKIDEDNQKYVEDWKRENMKIWVADYAYIDRDGNCIEETEDDPFGKYRIQVEALNIRDAIEGVEKVLKSMADESGWLEWKIYDVGICNQNIW